MVEKVWKATALDKFSHIHKQTYKKFGYGVVCKTQKLGSNLHVHLKEEEDKLYSSPKMEPTQYSGE